MYVYIYIYIHIHISCIICLALALAGDTRPVRRTCAMVLRERLAFLRRSVLSGCSGSVHFSFKLETECQKVKFLIDLNSQPLVSHQFSLMVSALDAVSAACDSHHVMDRGHLHGASGMSETCFYIKNVRQDTVETKNKPRNKRTLDGEPLPKWARQDNARPPRAEPSPRGEEGLHQEGGEGRREEAEGEGEGEGKKQKEKEKEKKRVDAALDK